MRIPKYEFDDKVSIVSLGDIHRGDENCDVDSLRSVIDNIASCSDTYWVSTGDMMNVALKTSKSSVYKSLSPDKELEFLERELASITSKCLGIVASNHHRRISDEVGMNLDKMISRRLGIPYLGKIGLLNIKVGLGCYYIAMHHGVGGGKRRGAKTNSLEDFATVMPSADIYLEGHTHSFTHFINEIPYIDKKRNNLASFQAHFITTGHFVKWEGSYAQDFRLKPMPIGSAKIILHPSSNGKDKRVDVDFIS